jgi:hypothetical protein
MGVAEPYTRTLDPGSYVFIVTFRAIASAGATNAECWLGAGISNVDIKNIDLDAINDRKVVTMLGTRTLAEPTRSACHAKPGLGPATTSATVRLSRCRSRRSTDQALTQPLAGRRRPRSLVTTARKGLRSQEGGKPRHSSVRESESRLAGEETRRCRPARERATRGSPRPAADNRQRALAAPSGTKRPENRLLDRASKATMSKTITFSATRVPRIRTR